MGSKADQIHGSVQNPKLAHVDRRTRWLFRHLPNIRCTHLARSTGGRTTWNCRSLRRPSMVRLLATYSRLPCAGTCGLSPRVKRHDQEEPAEAHNESDRLVCSTGGL